MSVLAIDAGTTGVTALIIAEDGTVAGRGYREFRQFFPRPGWVEHLPEDIWQATLGACGQALGPGDQRRPAGQGGPGGPGRVSCIGITNQRETAVIWDRATLAAPRPGDRLAGPQDRADSAPSCAARGWRTRSAR